MKRTLRYFANSSPLSCLSYSSSVILTTRYNQLNFLEALIGYVIHKQSKYELFVQQHSNKSQQLRNRNKIECRSTDSTVFISGKYDKNKNILHSLLIGNQCKHSCFFLFEFYRYLVLVTKHMSTTTKSLFMWINV